MTARGVMHHVVMIMDEDELIFFSDVELTSQGQFTYPSTPIDIKGGVDMSRKDSVEMKAADGHWMLSANPDLHEWERRAYIHTDQRVFLPGGPSEQRLFLQECERGSIAGDG